MTNKTLVDEIAALEEGQTFTKAVRCDGRTMSLKAAIVEATKMTNTISTAANRASARTGLAYTVERANHITKSQDIMAIVFVTAKKEQ